MAMFDESDSNESEEAPSAEKSGPTAQEEAAYVDEICSTATQRHADSLHTLTLRLNAAAPRQIRAPDLCETTRLAI